MKDSKPDSVIVVGAGVLGLSTATLLQEIFSNITVVAYEFPTSSPIGSSHADLNCRASADYASMWAGAHYRPIPQSSPQLKDEYELAVRTAHHMKQIARSQPASGVAIVPAAEYLESPPDENLALRTGDVYAFEGDDFKVFSQAELDALNTATEHAKSWNEIKWACEYTSYVINVHVYCSWLLDQFVARGGRKVQRRLTSISDAFAFAQNPPAGRVLVVNCSGRNFDHDPSVKIIRGQTVLVRQQYHCTKTRQTHDGKWSFLIPRPLQGGTIIGGTKDICDNETAARPETRRVLLENCVKYFPDFVGKVEDFDIVSDNVGRRPWREGGIRLEIDKASDGRTIVHGYGAGGRGYELSWGIAERIVELVKQSYADRAHL